MKEILKALFKTGSSSIISIILGMVTTKIIAITTGAAGIGLFSQLRQIWQTNTTLSTLNGQNAMIQGISSSEDKPGFNKTILLIYLAASLLISVILFLFADIFAGILLNSPDGGYIRLLSIINILSTMNIFFLGILNGYKEIGKFALIQIIAAFIMMAVSFPLIKIFDLKGLVLILLITQIITCIIAAFLVFKVNRFDFLGSRFGIIDAKKFIHIALTTFVVGFVTTATLLVIKTIIIQKQGLAIAGIFDAVWTLSAAYVMIILNSFSAYYLPTLSGIKNIEEQASLIQNILRLSLIIIIPLICCVIILKPLVIQLLYSPEFMPALDIMRWMLIGDYLKVIAWVLAMPVFAFANMKIFFLTEMLFNITFLLLSAIAIIFYDNIELIGIIFIVLYACNFLYYLRYTIINHNLQLTKLIVMPWITGLGLIILISIATWNDRSVNWLLLLILIPVMIILFLSAISKNERSQLLNRLQKKK